MIVEPRPVRFASTGLGGYAWTILTNLLQADPTLVRLEAVCDPQADVLAEPRGRLAEAGVRVYTDFDTMLARESVDAVWLPLPIHLHREYTERSLRAGLDVICEKPAAGSVQDVDAMIALRDRSARRVFVGFQDIQASATLPAKLALLEGRIGRVEHVSVWASWPRSLKYYARSAWAGALMRDGGWVLDSPLQNALAHPVHLALFLLGATRDTSAIPVGLSAELYRGNDIENADTTCLIADLDCATMTVFLTHLGEQFEDSRIVIAGRSGRLEVDHAGIHLYASTEHHWPADPEKKQPMIRQIARRLSGRDPDALMATLEMARSHTLLVNGSSEAAAVATIGEPFVRQVIGSDGPRQCVTGMNDVMHRCMQNRCLPSQLGDVAWARHGGRVDLRGYRSFAGPCRV